LFSLADHPGEHEGALEWIRGRTGAILFHRMKSDQRSVAAGRGAVEAGLRDEARIEVDLERASVILLKPASGPNNSCGK
jgi:hypothetical protein